jgi:hypothetical protein
VKKIRENIRAYRGTGADYVQGVFGGQDFYHIRSDQVSFLLYSLDLAIEV